MKKLALLLLCCCLMILQVWAQNRTVSGKVTDEKGNPISGVSVKSGKSFTVTDGSGNFSFSVNSSEKTVTLSSVNYLTKTVDIGTGTGINVIMAITSENLTDAIVVGYGTQKKASVTGAIASVGPKEIENRPFTSVDKALQGAVAGLQSVAASGQPGANQAILIRGISSISASTGPLWVLDGIPINTGDASRLQTTANLLSTLNPNDIESISVLKDASAQSIYGSRAANGVIIVTTKKGKAGRTVFKFDTEIGQNSIAYENKRYRPLNAQQFIDITRESLVNGGYSTTVVNNQLTALGSGNGVDFDWYDAITRKANQQQYNLSAQGGNDKTTFFVSGGHFFQEGVTVNSKFSRTNGNARITHKVNEKLSFNLNLNGGFVNQRAPLNGGAFGNPVLSAYFQIPTRSAYNADGSYNLTSLGGLHNTIALSEIDKRFLRQTSLRGSIGGEYKILKNLKFRTNYGADFNVEEEDQYNNPVHGDGAATNGRSFSYYTRYYNWVWTNILELQQNLTSNGDLSLNAQAGYEAQKSSGYFISVQSQVFPANFNYTLPVVGASPITASATISDYSFLSQFGIANLNYKNKYVLSGSFRRDGSSRFGFNNKYGNFWSIGGAYNLDNEEFMQDITFISQLKLRASYGLNGNAGIGNYDWLPLYSYGSTYNQQGGSAPSNVGDSSLTWELNRPLDLGIDFSILKNRVSVTVDYYNRKSEDLLLNVPLSRTSGFSSRLRNLGAMTNKGVEVTINAVPVQTKNFTWNINFNFSHNTNKVTSLPDGSDIADGNFIIRQGVAYRTFYLREFAGVDPANGDPTWYTDGTHTTTSSTYPGASSRILAGNALPKYFGAFSNSFTFKGFSLDAQLYYNFGNYVYDTWGSYYVGAGFGGTYNKVARILDRWTTPGQATDIPKLVYGGNKSFQSASTFYLNKGDFIRLRNIQLGYSLPKSLLSKVKVNNAFLYVRGTNLVTWVKDKNLSFDPEQGTTSASNLNVFIPKTITGGLNITF